MVTDLPKRLYLAGPMAGIAEHNFPLFHKVARWLRGQGYEVFNPAENKDGNVRQPRSFYMRIDIPALMASDAVVLLPGWQESRGASLEVWIALDLDLPICEYEPGDGMPVLERIERLDVSRLPFRC